jgi:hypothetical protein
MSGNIPPLPQYAFMAWCLVKAQGKLYLLLNKVQVNFFLYLVKHRTMKTYGGAEVQLHAILNSEVD